MTTCSLLYRAADGFGDVSLSGVEKKPFMSSGLQLTRREFLKLLEVSAAAMVVPRGWLEYPRDPLYFPSLNLKIIPSSARRLLMQVPPAQIDEDGYLTLPGGLGSQTGRVPLARTQWNLERHSSYDRLEADKPWGIVLHWYGDKDNFDRSITGYLRGFDEMRQVDDYETRTSAHFLVGKDIPVITTGQPISSIGIIQTQAPDKDGMPFLASHLQSINFQIHKEKQQYYVRALYQLAYQEPAIHSLLQDYFDGPRIDPNMDTIAIEIAGHDFDLPSSHPTDQQVANVVAVVWAIMKRYEISALNLMGHNEIQINKPDPGKRFMALIRYLIGLKVLSENDQKMKQLVFGPFSNLEGDTWLAVKKYFKFIRDYFVLVSFPFQVYEWEAENNYWMVFDDLFDKAASPAKSESPVLPVAGKILSNAERYLVPENHEGIDLYCQSDQPATQVNLVYDGVCIFTGTSKGSHPGKMVMFRHHLPEGTEVITIYSHLRFISNLKVGERYSQSSPIGWIEDDRKQRFVHFAVAYGATWETDLKNSPDIPSNVGTTWIKCRYLDPAAFLNLDKPKAS